MMLQPWEMDRTNVANIHKRNQELNQEIEDLYLEVEELHRETALLTGLMAGSYAYFLQHLMLGHQSQTGLSTQDCEKIVVDALMRVQASQNRFEYDFLSEIQAVLQKMSQPLSLDPYLQQIQQ